MKIFKQVFPDGSITWTNAKGQLHNKTEPAYYLWDKELWFLEGKTHRENGPALLGYRGVDTYPFYIQGVIIT